jgi:hypothetical protein
MRTGVGLAKRERQLSSRYETNNPYTEKMRCAEDICADRADQRREA